MPASGELGQELDRRLDVRGRELHARRVVHVVVVNGRDAFVEVAILRHDANVQRGLTRNGRVRERALTWRRHLLRPAATER
jgi:hypothetical protein